MTPEHQQSRPSMIEFQSIAALFTAPATALIVGFLQGNRNRAVALFFQLGHVLGCLLAG